jgi:hypothetical protein
MKTGARTGTVNIKGLYGSHQVKEAYRDQFNVTGAKEIERASEKSVHVPTTVERFRPPRAQITGQISRTRSWTK